MPIERYDPERACPKCGGKHIITRYIAPRPMGMSADEARRARRVGRISRVCQTCLYAWDELPLDSKSENDAD